MIQLIEAHPVEATAAACWIFVVVAGSMPAPQPNSGVAYRWAYSALNLAAANLESVMKARMPHTPMPNLQVAEVINNAAPKQP